MGRTSKDLNQFCQQNSKVMRLLSEVPLRRLWRRIREADYIQKLEKVIDQAFFFFFNHRLYPGEAGPSIYRLPKLHKTGTQHRSFSAILMDTSWTLVGGKFLCITGSCSKVLFSLQPTCHTAGHMTEVSAVIGQVLVQHDITMNMRQRAEKHGDMTLSFVDPELAIFFLYYLFVPLYTSLTAWKQRGWKLFACN